MADQNYDYEIIKLSLSNLSKRCVNIFLGRERLRLLKLARAAFNNDTFDVWGLIDTEASAAAWASSLYVLSDKPNIQTVFGKHTAKVHRGRIAEASLHVLLRDEPDMPTLGLVAGADHQQPSSGLSLDQRRRLSRFLTQWEQEVMQQEADKAPESGNQAHTGVQQQCEFNVAVETLKAVVEGGLAEALTVADGATSTQKCNAVMNRWLDSRNDDEIFSWSQDDWVAELRKKGFRFSKKTVAATAKLENETEDRCAWRRVMKYRMGSRNELLVSKETEEDFFASKNT